ncbi:MAG: hypothetical protein WED34_09480 [Planctomycetales bacterium]
MHALLVTLAAAVALAEPGTTTIYNARSLVDRDWMAVVSGESTSANSRVPQQTATRLILSLRPGERWDDGKAWVLRIPPAGAPQVWKGYFTFRADANDEDNLILSLRITRKYHGQYVGEQLQWELDSDWEPTGVYADIPLIDSTVPKQLTISSRRAFYVDAKGNFTRRSYRPSGLIDAILNGGEEETPYEADFLPLDSTHKFTSADVAATLKTLKSNPPSFAPRSE